MEATVENKSPMQFRLADLLWIITVVACLLGWVWDHNHQIAERDRAVELMRRYKDACVDNDAMYRREAAEVDRQFLALRVAANELERRLSELTGTTVDEIAP
jgi:hypothetical protein